MSWQIIWSTTHHDQLAYQIWMLFGLTTSDRFAEKRMNRKIEKLNIQDINMTYITKCFVKVKLVNQEIVLIFVIFLIRWLKDKYTNESTWLQNIIISKYKSTNESTWLQNIIISKDKSTNESTWLQNIIISKDKCTNELTWLQNIIIRKDKCTNELTWLQNIIIRKNKCTSELTWLQNIIISWYL